MSATCFVLFLGKPRLGIVICVPRTCARPKHYLYWPLRKQCLTFYVGAMCIFVREFLTDFELLLVDATYDNFLVPLYRSSQKIYIFFTDIRSYPVLLYPPVMLSSVRIYRLFRTNRLHIRSLFMWTEER